MSDGEQEAEEALDSHSGRIPSQSVVDSGTSVSWSHLLWYTCAPSSCCANNDADASEAVGVADTSEVGMTQRDTTKANSLFERRVTFAEVTKGTLVRSDGSVYQGEVVNGQAHGFGKLTLPDGSEFEGMWKSDLAHGFGSFVDTNGGHVQGEWRDNQKNGYVQERWGDGTSFEGQFVSGRKHGEGTYRDATGKVVFRGQFHHGKMHGSGKYRFNDGRCYEGQFEGGQMHGQGTMEWPSGGGTLPGQPTVKQLLMPAAKQCQILGEGEQGLDWLRAQTGAQVQISKSEGMAHVKLHMSGAAEAVGHVEALVSSWWDQVIAYGFVNADYQYDAKTVDVPQEFVGEIIGFGGCNLRHMSSRSNCQIKFQNAATFDATASPGKQVCVITGPEHLLDVAEKLIFEKMTELQSIHSVQSKQHHQRQKEILGRAPKIPCKFHMRQPGSCRMGDACSWSHDPDVISRYKSSICSHWEQGNCPHGDKCLFAHGAEELHQGKQHRPAMCRNWEQGFCAHGNRCFFAHDEPVRRISAASGAPAPPPDRPSDNPSFDVSAVARLAETQLQGMLL